jgi:hypothetical protein
VKTLGDAAPERSGAPDEEDHASILCTFAPIVT